MAALKSDCRKFAPNIFNKTKCQNCFRGKDVHSAEALESNRATRKMCLCGYLFVAPDWDFSLPANRNKRWQRRWFMLYDDGELAYSVDECPETVPQAVVDMNCVLEVTDAESVTGNQFALAITLPEKVHFIKGTSKEETKKWFEVLSRFPRNTVCGKYKRNATFPGIKLAATQKAENNFTDWVNRRETVQVTDYSKSNGYVSSLNRNAQKHNSSVPFDPDDDVIPTKDTGFVRNVRNHVEQQKEKNSDHEAKSAMQYKLLTKDAYDLISSSSLKSNTRCESPQSDLGKRDHVLSGNSFTRSALRSALKERLLSKTDITSSYLKQELRELKKLHSQSDITPMIPSLEKSNSEEWKKVPVDIDNLGYNGKNYHNNPLYVLMSDVPSSKKYESFIKAEKLHSVRRQGSFGKKSDLLRHVSSWAEEDQADADNEMISRRIHKSASVPNATLLSEDKKRLPLSSSFNRPLFVDESSKDRLVTKLGRDYTDKAVLDNVRGDPDGCNLDSPPSCCVLSPDIPNDTSSEVLSLKKGWLVKQEHNKWNKHWFVLRNSALTFYTDPIAEDSGILDGVVDLRKVQNVSEVQSSSGHTFAIMMKDDTKLLLSAVTAKMRNNWIRAIVQAAKLKESNHSEGIERKANINNSVQHSKEIFSISAQCNMQTPNGHTERKLSKQSSKSSLVSSDDHVQPHLNSVALPPSPPVARTAISRVKERARTRTHTRTSRFGSPGVQEPDHNYIGDSDDGTTDHSSSSLSATPVAPAKEKQAPKEPASKPVKEKISRSERKSSLKLSSGDSLTPQDKRKKVFEIKDKLEDSSWTIWLDVSKFCKEVEAKLDDFEKHDRKDVLQRSNCRNADEHQGEQKKEVGHLVSCLIKVEKRLRKVHNELEKAKVDLLLTNKDGDLDHNICKSIVSLSSLKDLASLTGSPAQNVLLAQQLSRTKEENRRLKQDLKTAQMTSDNFELSYISLKQELKQKEELYQSQMDLMVARVEDLTTKLLNSEKNVRQLRQRVAKLEQRQERRRSSLKGKEGLTLSKEYESKLSELEQKIDAVEGVLKISETSAGVTSPPAEKESSGKETQSLLIRLHNLDKKVKGVTEIIDQASPENAEQQEDFMKPKIQLQVKLEGNTLNHDTNEGWNCLSLSTSMTDLSNLESRNEEGNIAISFDDCLENMNYKITSLVSWLKSTLQLMHDEKNRAGGKSSSETPEDSSPELGYLIKAIDHTSSAIDLSSIIPKGLNDITEKLLYKIVLLQEIASIVFKMSNFDKYKVTILVQHLTRVKQAVSDIELYISQKSNSISASSSKTSLCNIVANLLFYRLSLPAENSDGTFDIEKFYSEVENEKKRVSATIFVFKEKFIENFCSTILELSENSIGERLCSSTSIERQLDVSPVGQKQFLSHINHIITQVSNAFVAHISKSVNDLYFVCSDVQYSSKWVTYICKLLQQELIRLSSEIKTVCIKQLGYDFYSGSKCGVLVEYMHCSIWELAQIVSVNSVAEGTMVLIKDAMSRKHDGKSQMMMESRNCTNEENVGDLESFHHSLLQRAGSFMSNLSTYPYCNIPWNFCNSSEANVAHRSVSSLLCFKQKWKTAIETERLNYKAQIEQQNQQLNCLREELKRREKEGCRTCIELRQEVSYLQGELDESRALARLPSICEKCSNLKLDIQKLMEQHERDTFMIQKLEKQETEFKLKMEKSVKEKDVFFSEEKQNFEKELRAAQRQLKTMEKQYKEDLHKLQNLYEQKMLQPRNDIVRCRYSSEIDQLKSLCEKGLEAMESSHQRIVTELEQRHQKEVEDLIMEKEKVLEEEAHATAIALEAVRKVHKDELQKQIKVFKDQFMQKMSARFENEAFKKGYESEITKIKHEILSITEKYSVKCLENITLQENLENVTEQLNATHGQVNELRARNKQLQAQLASDCVQKLGELM